MCGLFGNITPGAVDLNVARHALHMVAHRGPDQWGEWSDDRVYIGHRRLSILDLSDRGRQPMTDAGQNVVIAVNGEIYNFARLRAELEDKHEFVSHSDSEVVLHGFKEWGIEGLLSRMDGMYALVIYDRSARRLFLARDRVGIKPLYYARFGESFAWASELKSIQDFFGVNRLRVDVTALYDFLTYLYIPAPKSLYRDVFKLEPGHYAAYDLASNQLQVTSYWKLSGQEMSITTEDAGEELMRLVDESVGEQLMSDVPVGIFLSGGLDSGIVAESASRRSRHISTFTIQVDEPGHDESAHAQLVADRFGTTHHVRTCKAVDADQWLQKMRDWYDEPFGDASAIPTHLVSRFSRDAIVVALSGDGGDEIFGGYRWYAAMQHRAAQPIKGIGALRPLSSIIKRAGGRSLPGRAARRLEFDYILNDLEYYTRLMGGLLADDKRAFGKKWGIDPDYDDYWYFRKHWRIDLPLMTRLQYLDFHTYLPDDILTKVDRASMQVALEVRVPLLSRNLIEFSFSLPEPVRYAGGVLKGLLKSAYRERLPAAILQKPKQGFGLPVRAWEIADGRLGSLQERILREQYPDCL